MLIISHIEIELFNNETSSRGVEFKYRQTHTRGLEANRVGCATCATSPGADPEFFEGKGAR